MGRHTVAHQVLTTDIIAVVDNDQCIVNKVTRGLPFFLSGRCTSISLDIFPNLIGNSACVFDTTSPVQVRQKSVFLISRLAHTVDVLGIDETTANALGNIDKVELYHTCDNAPLLGINCSASTLFGSKFQIYT